jgi:four helix bundle protein
LKKREDNIVYIKSFSFAVKIVELYKTLCEDRREFVLSRQLLKAGTSIGANIREAIEGQSKKDLSQNFRLL